jgi:hypothetical protein
MGTGKRDKSRMRMGELMGKKKDEVIQFTNELIGAFLFQNE